MHRPFVVLPSACLLALATTIVSAAEHSHPAHGAAKPAHTHEASFGKPGDPRSVTRTIDVSMSDTMRFSPSAIEVKSGEVIRFVARNDGKLPHEMVLGTMKDLQAHAEEMKKSPHMEHDAPYMVHVEPGKTKTMVWQFTEAGQFYYGCLVPGHFESGMIGKVGVVAQAADHGDHQHGKDMHSMKMTGMFGLYSMNREASGTSWQPDSAAMEGIHGSYGGWSTMIHGFANAIYDKQKGPRGDSKSFGASMLMIMAQREHESGTLGLRGMFSLDPLTMGKSGYPLLFQTGETANGTMPLVDRQHPHDLFMELAASYSYRLSTNSAIFGYFGLPGEPALGPPTFMHRFSGIDNPEAPLSHHWLDSTHISFGVATLGYVWDGLKLEASLFNAREPNQNRYDIEVRKLNSSSLRLSYNLDRDWAMQVSYGHLKSPEQLEPNVDVNRTTASIMHNRAFGGGNWQTTFAWGRNAKKPGRTTDAYLLESAITLGTAHTIFGRLERVGKDELFHEDEPLAGQIFTIKKASVGYIYDFASAGHAKFGVGALVSKHFIPSTLVPVYGDDPTSYMLFARVKIQ